MFDDRYLARVEEIMRAVCADFETVLVVFNGQNNHFHLLVNFPPKGLTALPSAGLHPRPGERSTGPQPSSPMTSFVVRTSPKVR